MLKKFLHTIQRKLLKIRLQPIRVLCFHQVSDVFDSSTTWECDWMQTNVFKQKILDLSKEYTFISLEDAYDHLSEDKFRIKKYAVLTMDDASNCIINLMPWLAENNIPITLFVPTTFIIGKNRRHKCGISLTKIQFENLLKEYSSFINIASHGYDHIRATTMLKDELREDIQKAKAFLSNYDAYTAFFAYPGGYHTKETDALVKSENLIPVYIDGQKNYKCPDVIHRESL